MILGIAIAVAVVIGFGGGWGVKGWKDGAEIALAVAAKEKVESRNAILDAANTSCATDIQGVREGVKLITDAVGEREKAASAAMRQAQIAAAKHTQAVREIHNAPAIPVAQQCQAIEREQIEYVKNRKANE